MKHALTLFLLAATLGAKAQSPLTLYLESKAGAGPMQLNVNFNEHNGRTTVMDRLSYYLCDFEIVHDGGSITPLPGVYVLVHGTRTDYPLGTTGITNIEAIHFAVGIDASVNHNDPNGWPSGHPLALQNPSMHWGWNAGYKFAAFEGEGDANNDNDPETMWQLHPTGDVLFRQVSVPVTPISDANGLGLYLEYDMQQWLRDIDLPTIGAEHGATGAALTVMDNLNTYTVFRAAGTTGVEAPAPAPAALAFNHIDPTHPIAHYRVRDAQGAVSLRITDLNGVTVFERSDIGAEGMLRIEAALAQGVYVASLSQDGQALLHKKFQVFR